MPKIAPNSSVWLVAMLLCALAYAQNPPGPKVSGTVTAHGGVVIQGGSPSSVSSLAVLPTGMGVPVGATVQFTATAYDDSSNAYNACLLAGWTSANPSIATVNAATGAARGVSAGTTQITCADYGRTSASTLVVETAPDFSNPATPCTAPCLLPSGTQGQAYTDTLTAAGGTAPYTYSVTIGSLPTGLTLASGGLMSGTPTVLGGSIFTVQVCDSLSACTPLQMSLTILAVAVGNGGPPDYSKASTSTADTTTPLTSIFTSTASTPTTCSGQCQNAVAEDTQMPGHQAGTYKYTRITDGVSLAGKSVSNFTSSGGSNNRVFSYPNGRFLYITTFGGTYVFELSVVGTTFQVVNSGANPLRITGLGLDTSWTTETRFYHVRQSDFALMQGDLNLTGGHLVNGTSTYTDTFLFNFATAGNCPGNWARFTPSQKSDIGIRTDDDTITMSMGGGGQGSADVVFSYSRTRGPGGGPGCAVTDLKQGKQWGFLSCTPGSCTGTETPTATFADVPGQCWGTDGSTGNGIHNSQGSGDGNYVTVSQSKTWTKGGCAGQATSGNVIIGINNGTNQFCDKDALSCNGHNSEGISRDLHTYWATGFTNRPYSDITAFTTFLPMPAAQDEHCSWPHNNGGVYDDTMPWLCAGNSATTIYGGVYTPKYLNNEVYAVDPGLPSSQTPKRFGHTFACGPTGYGLCSDNIADPFGAGNAIGAAHPKGYGYCFATSMLHQLGNDSTGVPRGDAFCIYTGPQ